MEINIQYRQNTKADSANPEETITLQGQRESNDDIDWK